jgi:tetratricopeptide (TPR) repeat protein
LADVFLSYARPDAASAERIARELGKAGWSVWYDRELPAHRAYADVIASELESAASVLVLWSEAAAGSEWVRSEANRARELHKLVQARLDGARLPMPFDQIQCADLCDRGGARRRSGWSQVRKSIGALVGGERHVGSSGARAAGSATTRRAVLIGAGAAIAAAGAGTFWLRGRGERQPDPEAALLFQKGTDALQNNDVFAADNPGSLGNAIALLTQATQADPHYAKAWGSLALAYAGLKRVSPVSQRPGLDSRSRSAAAETFKLEPHEPRATCALLLLDPLYRHWRAAEQADRAALKTSKAVPLLQFLLSETLGSVGRWREAAAVSITADRKHFIIPGADRRVVVDLWAAGDLQGADQALRQAVDHWPQQPQVWRTRLDYLMYSGRPTDALAVLRNEADRPSGILAELVDVIDATARALAAQGSPREAVDRSLDYLKSHPSDGLAVAQAAAALGDLDTSFAVLNGYYFGEGAWSETAPAAGDQDRATSPLFLPPMKTAWGDPRFARLLQRIGLEDYWRQSRTLPDFRRAA